MAAKSEFNRLAESRGLGKLKVEGFTTPEEGKVTVGVVFVLAGTDPAVTAESRNDAQFLDSEANAAMNEMMGMIASLRIATPSFKSDGTQATNKTFTAEEAKPLAVQISSDKQSLGAHGIATLKAVVEGGKAPYTYAWTGSVPPTQVKAESVQVQAPAKIAAAQLPLGVTVTEAAGKHRRYRRRYRSNRDKRARWRNP